jgi:biopolymer transport protein ExbD
MTTSQSGGTPNRPPKRLAAARKTTGLGGEREQVSEAVGQRRLNGRSAKRRLTGWREVVTIRLRRKPKAQAISRDVMPLKVPESALQEPEINLTPMIDVVFLLIIFFMVGTQFTNRERKYDIDLPTVSEALPLTQLPDHLVINVYGDGRVFLTDNGVTLQQLEQELLKARENYADQEVIIRGEGIGPYQHITDVLSVGQKVQFEKMTFATQLPDL